MDMYLVWPRARATIGPSRDHTVGVMDMRGPTSLLLLSALVSSSLYAQAPWIDEGKPLQRQVEAAKRNDVAAADATRQLISVGRQPAETVQTVARVYGGCEDLRAAVAAGVSAAPRDAQLIMESVVALEDCSCSSGDLWPQQRLDGRLRVASWRQGISFAPASACIAAAAESAVKAAPDQADAVLKGVVAAARRGGTLVDSIGQVGALPDNLPREEYWKRGEQAERRCATDLQLEDDPAYDQRFASKSTASDVVDAAAPRCDGANDLLIDGLATAYRADSALVLRNDTDRPIDLDLGGYVVEVYHAGSKNLGRRVALSGIVAPGQEFVVAPAEAAMAGKAQLTTPSARFAPGDTVALRRASYETDCSGVPAAVGSIANSLGGNASRWLEATSEQYSDEGKALKSVDAVGQVGAGAQAWLGEQLNRSFTLTRNNDPLCAGRVDAASPFAVANNWSLAEGVAVDQIGAANVCQGYSADVVIAKYKNDAENFRVVELLNNTAGEIDLAQRGYMLEIYADAASTPTATVALKGRIPAGGTFVITDDGAPAEVRERAQVVTADLRQNAVNALVLNRVTADSIRNCTAEVLAVTRDVEAPVAFIPAQQFPASREPMNDDPIVQGNRGGQLATPN